MKGLHHLDCDRPAGGVERDRDSVVEDVRPVQAVRGAEEIHDPLGTSAVGASAQNSVASSSDLFDGLLVATVPAAVRDHSEPTSYSSRSERRYRTRRADGLAPAVRSEDRSRGSQAVCAGLTAAGLSPDQPTKYVG